MWKLPFLLTLLAVGAEEFEDVGDDVDVFALAAAMAPPSLAVVVESSDEVGDDVDVFALAMPKGDDDAVAPCGKFAVDGKMADF